MGLEARPFREAHGCTEVNSMGDTPDREGPLLYLDKDGRWFHEGVEITHAKTRSLFLKNLARGEDERYYVRIGRECASVEVEDTPFLVTSVTVTEGSGGPGRCEYRIHLNDGSDESLDPRTLTIEQNNVLYGRVKENAERARFLRSAYYQLCARVEYAEQEDRYILPWRGSRIPLRIRGTPPVGSGV